MFNALIYQHINANLTVIHTQHTWTLTKRVCLSVIVQQLSDAPPSQWRCKQRIKRVTACPQPYYTALSTTDPLNLFALGRAAANCV